MPTPDRRSKSFRAKISLAVSPDSGPNFVRQTAPCWNTGILLNIAPNDSFESLLSRSNQHGNLGRNDREFLRQKANAGSEDGNGGDEVQGTVIIRQSYTIRSTRCVPRQSACGELGTGQYLQSRKERGHVSRSDRALLCAQSAAIARHGDQLAELWRWVSAKVLRQQLNQATVETARCATKKKQ